MLLPHPSRFGDELSEGPRLLSAAQQGQQVHRRVQLRSLVHAPVHVDRHAGDHQQIPVNVHQTAHKAVSLPDHHPARHRQGPVQPATPHTAAVRLTLSRRVLPAEAASAVSRTLKVGESLWAAAIKKP